MFKELTVTIEEYVEGEFQKYVNNNGLCILSPAEEFDEIYVKAQCLVHYSYQISERKLMLLDIQGSSFEVNFCAGNLSCIASDECNSKHTCNKHCEMLSLEKFD